MPGEDDLLLCMADILYCPSSFCQRFPDLITIDRVSAASGLHVIVDLLAIPMKLVVEIAIGLF